ncbi:MAG: MFS transporter [Proteobacteria bacterium]|nr:MFS transporter [Pseudomonadota bacterium]NIS67640.1 MFS transporter [Pseudomonadota bacterium]
MTREERKIIGVTTAAHGLNHGFILIFAAVLPMLQKDFQTDYFHLGLIGNICFFAYGLGSLPAGVIADRIGSRTLISLYLFGAGLSSFFVAFSNSLTALAISIGLVGMFCSTYHPSSNALISRGIKKPGKGFGIHGVAGSFGVALTPLVAGFLASILGWKTAYAMFGVAGMALGFVSLTLQEVAHKNGKDKIQGDAAREGSGFSVLPLIVFFATSTLIGLCYRGVMTFLPTYMAQKVQIGFLPIENVALGGMMSTVALLFGTIGQYLGGNLSDRYLPEKVYFGALLLGAPSLFLVGLSTNLPVVLSALAYAFFYFSTQPTGSHLLARYTSVRFRGTAYGIHFFLGFGVGSFASSVSGYLADHLGLEWVFYAMGYLFVVSGMLAFVLILLSRKNPPLTTTS